MATSRKFRRARLIAILLAVVLVAALAWGGWWSVQTVRASSPQTTGSITLKGLSGPVQVDRDKNGIPQIYASSSADLFRAQGYVQAQDRFYEMDTRRHITSGRLSEMFGSSQVKTDAFLRTMGWHRVAQQEWDHTLSPSTKRYLTAYTAGVNDYLKDHSGAAISMEYKLLDLAGKNYKPQKWSPVDSVAWLKAMAWDLRDNMEDEITRAQLPERLNQSEIDELYPSYPAKRNQPIVTGGGVDSAGAFDPKLSGSSGGTSNAAVNAVQGDAGARSALKGVQKQLDQATKALGSQPSGIGSNSWVVSGDHTTTGKPLLANDPHLSPALPSVWYQMGLHCTTVSASCPFDVTGYTFSGMPGVVIGHNQSITWGLTNSGVDVSDLYLEKIQDDKVLYDGSYVPITQREETIKVAGGKPRTITVRTTRNGPLISDRDDQSADVGRTADVPSGSPDRRDGYAVALKWTALQPGTTMDSVFALDKAQDFAQFRDAAKDFDVPSQNLVYADTKGNIGYQLPGRIPVRGDGDGSVPAPGWDPKYQWKSYIPFKALPWEENPSSGYIVTANQAVVGKDYPYHLTSDWGYGNRSQRITTLLKSKLKNGGLISPDDMASIQMDDRNPLAATLTPYLLKVKIKDSYVSEAQTLLKTWDYDQDPDSAAAAYYNAVWRQLLRITFGEKLPAAVRPEGQCLWVTPADEGSSGVVDDLSGQAKKVRECGQRPADSAEPNGGDRWEEVVRDLLPKADNHWWTTPQTYQGRTIGTAKGRDAVLAEAMKDARYELTAKLGKDISTWSWGRLHKLDLKNQTLGTSGPSFVRYLLNRGPYEMGGGEDTVDATGWNAAAGYEVDLVPSMRMVVDLSDWDKSRYINLTGASGHAYNAHYTDQAAKWQKGELLPWAYTANAVKSATKDKLVLTPN
ncbi:penicillin acylase family protein [Mangrovactinospora gilvigrisea]|uniref:Penicillin acylase family protein n=1 Tax=Mangrovactinospora gilvigrisea TaxID=1428644 RepID=A0A1J7CAK8_9ACTN|nr:penicillin acylase family protein [Mangrovactinospora gilvigrisea]